MKMGRSAGVIYLLILQVFMIYTVEGVIKVGKWRADGFCGDRIAESSRGGTLIFKVEKIRWRHGYGECKLTVAPEQLPGSHGNGKVLMYFEFFELPGRCSDSSVTLLDGSSHNSPRVQGAPDPLCQHNTSLTQTRRVFYTSGSEFTVLFRLLRSNSRADGIVVLNFASYFDGPCGGSDKVVTCVNKQCTASRYHCHYDIDTCGPDEDAVCKKIDDAKGGIGAGLGRMAIAIVIFVVVCCLCGGVIQVIRSNC